ncbi:MAG: iron ABC transporter permease [Paludibacteraceae bacterium]|nr:iron ABC transporter permease [Paludibacteraceae bacterium]
MKKHYLIFASISLFLLVLACIDVASGSQWIPLWSDHLSLIQQQILFELRIPKTITAILAGAALSISGLMMQTLFRNPLAGPYILGISSGASLGVALVTIGGLTSLLGTALGSNIAISLAAIVGATLVLLLVLAVARRIETNVSLLIVGMMIGSIAGALVNIMQNFSNPDALKLFITWTFGSLSSVGWSEMQVLLPIMVIGFVFSALLIKNLDGLRLGENYAHGIGISVPRTRLAIVLATGLLAGGVTVFCGPIAFVGVAVPHIARGILGTSSHRLTMPMAALVGALLLVICDLLCSLGTYPLPVSTISALFGAPVIIWIILRKP